MQGERFDGWTRRLTAVMVRRCFAGRSALGVAALLAGRSASKDTYALQGERGNCRTVSKSKVRRYIKQAADRYNQPYKKMLCVAECESWLDNCAVNRAGQTYGVFQFKRATWDTTKYAGKDLWDPKWNALAAAWMWSKGRENEWDCCCPRWDCDCPGKNPSWC